MLSYGILLFYNFYSASSLPPIFSDFLIEMGLLGFLIFCIRCTALQNQLERPLLRCLGEISFSIYLLHAVIFIPFIRYVYSSESSMIWLFLTSFGLILLLGQLFYTFIENPSRKAGKLFGIRLANRFARKN
ncbi:hypothetical protein MFLO_11130 [Listeria floridensis FSL S10-1187]|uniref:Acyltransferase n=1 Tax=Listeria floridensis FSL S10-1187 TaxID=1265817 RepID=A0ABP3AWG0_9LIST|nr:hypothetical protein MFLO_11130 [Listeria floridensis FSL S10-1187]